MLSLFVAAIMLLTMMPFSAFAAESETSERDELIALACEVFPEYAPAIRGETASTYSRSRSGGENEVVFTETRTVSDTQNISITQLSSGDIVIVKQDTDSFEIKETASSSDYFSGGTSGSASFKVTCTGVQGIFELKNLKFTIYTNGSDYFSSYGTVSTAEEATYNLASDSSTTYRHYKITFRNDSSVFPTDFEVYFSNNQVVGRVYV